MNPLKSIRLPLLVLALACGTAAHAWPTKPIRIIVPSSAGAAPDTMIRLIAARMSVDLKQQVVIENKVGAGGIPARQNFELTKDDHTFLLTLTSTTTIAPLVFKAASSYDYLRDAQPVMTIGQTPFMIVANPANGATRLEDLVSMARSKPGEVAFATPPLSSSAQLSVTVLSHLTGLQFNVIPFSRSGESLAAVSTGDAAFFVDTVSVVMPFVRAQRVRPIAVLSAEKLPGLEAYPLAKDAVPGFEVGAGFGLVAPKEMDRSSVDAMVQLVQKAVSDPELVRKLQDMAIFVKPAGPDAYRAQLLKEADFWGKVVRSAKIAPQ